MTVLIAKSNKEIRFYSRNSFVCILQKPCLDLDKQKVSMGAGVWVYIQCSEFEIYLLIT